MGKISQFFSKFHCGSAKNVVSPQQKTGTADMRTVLAVDLDVKLDHKVVKQSMPGITREQILAASGLVEALTTPILQKNRDSNQTERWNQAAAAKAVGIVFGKYEKWLKECKKKKIDAPAPLAFVTLKLGDFWFVSAYLKHKREGTLSQDWQKFDQNFTKVINNLTVTDFSKTLYRGMMNTDAADQMVEGKPYVINQPTYASPKRINAIYYAGGDPDDDDRFLEGDTGVIMQVFHPDKVASFEPMGDRWQAILPEGQKLTTLFKHEITVDGQKLSQVVLTGANSGDKGTQARLVEALTLAPAKPKPPTRVE